jgi:hypothetical protein
VRPCLKNIREKEREREEEEEKEHFMSLEPSE